MSKDNSGTFVPKGNVSPFPPPNTGEKADSPASKLKGEKTIDVNRLPKVPTETEG